MNATNRPAVSVSQLVKSYTPDRPNAVDGVSFEVQRGEVFGLLGPNGAGKTTTVKMILGLVLPTSGSVHLAGYDMSSQRRRGLRHAGAVLEGARNIYWRLSARANLEYFGALRGLRRRDVNNRIEEILALVGLSDRADQETRHLSRGMQQKVALAVAVLHDPDVLLLDEPTLGLDVQASKTIESVVRELAEEQGKAVLLTTHQMALAERSCNRIFVINEGVKVAEGPTAEVVERFGAQHQSVEIRTGGIVGEGVLARIRGILPSLAVSDEEGSTVLSWSDSAQQRQLLEVLNLLDEAGLPILNVGRREATLEQVFLRLTSEEVSLEESK